jgi:hypothetical protein
MTVKMWRLGTNISMKAIKSKEMRMILCPSIIKARRPYFSKNCPANRVTAIWTRFRKAKTLRTPEWSY